MAGASYYVHRIRSLPPQQVVRKVHARIARHVEERFTRRADLTRCTYAEDVPAGALLRYFSAPDVEPERAHLSELCDNYFAHRFDLLGSGWVQVAHGMSCAGLEGHRYDMAVGPTDTVHLVTGANRSECRRVRSLISPGYNPIDWQRDFKSGWRWSEATWYRDITYGGQPGVDVKVPWELARLHHLPQIAMAAGLRAVDARLAEREFRDQVLDFVSANPPRLGVNWACTMDVAIRCANLLVAQDVFRANGAVFDNPFEEILRRTTWEHGLHIANNLEWSEQLRGNHYLADICGLLFAAAYLPSSPACDEWLMLAHRELLAQVAQQFQEDGSNFEASTCYHLLSAQMVVYATALVLALPIEKRRLLADDPVPAWLMQRIARMGAFAMDSTRPDGHVAQIGDNDSGRFLKLSPVYDGQSTPHESADSVSGNHQHYSSRSGHLSEDHLDPRHVLAACWASSRRWIRRVLRRQRVRDVRHFTLGWHNTRRDCHTRGKACPPW